MSLTMFFSLFGGLGLFIYGMKQMSMGLQKAAGKNLKKLLRMLTSNRFAGLMVGTVVTAIIQSSSATTVMIVGFVNAGLMTLTQSIGVIMGANIGTTVTAQLIAFKVSHYALHAIAIGAGLYLFSRTDKTKQVGQVVLGFGMLFLGLTIMKDTMAPLRDSAIFVDVMQQIGIYPILGLLLGTVMTIMMQSSSASIGILMSLVAVGVIDFQVAVPVLLGTNIGTTVTALLSSIGTNKTAKKAAAAHFIFNVIGSGVIVLVLHLMPNFINVIDDSIRSISLFFGQNPSPERMLANTHTIFNITNTLVWLPFVGLMVKFVNYILPGIETSLKRGLVYLDDRMLETPSMALDQVKKEIMRAYQISMEMAIDATKSFINSDVDVAKSVNQKEDVVNDIEEELVGFLTKFPRATMSKENVDSVNMYYAMIDDIESIADDADEIANLTQYQNENNIKFSENAHETLDSNFELIELLLKQTEKLIETGDLSLTERIFAGEEEMDDFQLKNRNRHMERLGQGVCDPNAGIVYLEFLESLEHISDQTADIAHSMLELEEKGKSLI